MYTEEKIALLWFEIALQNILTSADKWASIAALKSKQNESGNIKTGDQPVDFRVWI